MAKSVTLVDEVGELTVRADQRRLEQVLTNLVDNAVKYGGNGGRVMVGARERDGMVEIFVQDSGAGLPTESLERVFERFYRREQISFTRSGRNGAGIIHRQTHRPKPRRSRVGGERAR